MENSQIIDNDKVIFAASDSIGRGDDELGAVLARAFFNTLCDEEILPATILFMNAGVKLACEGSAVLDSLKKLESLGIEMLSCGTCLDYYGIKDKLIAGSVSNMYEIQGRLLKAKDAVTL